MRERTYIEQIARNLTCSLVDIPTEIALVKVSNDGEEPALDVAVKLHHFYKQLYERLGSMTPADLGLPELDNVRPVDKILYDKCVQKVLQILLVLYAVGYIGEYHSERYVSVNGERFVDLCKKLKVSGLDKVLERLKKLGVDINKQEDGSFQVWFAYDDDGSIIRNYCFFIKQLSKDKPDDSKQISQCFRCDFSSFIKATSKKQTYKDEEYLVSTLPKEKAEMLTETFRILREEMDCRADIKLPVYKGIIKGAFSGGYKNRKTGRTLVSVDIESGDIILRLNFTSETLRQVFQAAKEFPAEIFENIKKSYCRGKDCMGHEGVYIPEAGISFCTHIIKYELQDITERKYADFIKLLRLQYQLLRKSYNIADCF